MFLSQPDRHDRQYSDQYLYEELGLIRLLPMLANRSNAKV
jgi:hypothetical protein